MKPHTPQLKRGIIIGWLGLIALGMYASIFFLATQHRAMVVPCAGMMGVVCPILQHDLMVKDHPLVQPSLIEYIFFVPTSFQYIFASVFIMLAIHFFWNAWQHIRKRNYLFALVHRYIRALARGILQNRVYA